MKRILDFFRALIISPEFLIVLISILLYKTGFQFFTKIGSRIQGEEKIWQFLPSLPFLFSSIVFKYSNRILAPSEKNNKILYKWPLYKHLKNRVYVSILICLLCCLISLYIWFFEDVKDVSIIGVIFFNSILVSGVTALSNFFASQKLKEILALGIDDK